MLTDDHELISDCRNRRQTPGGNSSGIGRRILHDALFEEGPVECPAALPSRAICPGKQTIAGGVYGNRGMLAIFTAAGRGERGHG